MNIIEPNRPIEYIATLPELLALSEPPDNRFSKVDVYRLPNTTALDERYVITIAGPEAAYILTAICERVQEFARAISHTRQKQADAVT